MSKSGSMQTKPVPAPRRGRKPKEPSASDNCRMCGCVSNVFVAPTRIGETLRKLADLLRKENLSPQEFAIRAEQRSERLETVLGCLRKLQKN